MNQWIMKQPVMNKVLYSLIPIVLFAVFLYGWRALCVVIVTNGAAFITEYMMLRKKKGGKVSMAVFVTGTLLALTLPPSIPYWIAIVGAVFGVFFGKMVYGGFGMNIFNPAIVGRTFIYVSFPKEMTVIWWKPFSILPGGFVQYMPYNAVTTATPMTTYRDTHALQPLWDLFSGITPNIGGGCMGESSALLLLLVACYLIATKAAKWQPMVACLLSFTLFSLLFYHENPLYFLFSGGIIFGSILMITDPISMAKTAPGIWIYGALVGFLTVFIRRYSLFIEGFMFALLLGNTFMPIIEYFIQMGVKPKTQTPS